MPLDTPHPNISPQCFEAGIDPSPTHTVLAYIPSSSMADELPNILTGKAPAKASSIGSGNFASPPQALFLGGGFEQADIDKLKALAESTSGAAQIPWLWVDASKGGAPEGKPSDEEIKVIAEKVAARIKEGANKLKAEGKLGDGNAGVHMV